MTQRIYKALFDKLNYDNYNQIKLIKKEWNVEDRTLYR